MIKRLLGFLSSTMTPEIQMPPPRFGVRVMDESWLRETFRNREEYIRQSHETRMATLAPQPRSFAVRTVPQPEQLELRLPFLSRESRCP